ncbi:MAG: metallophosphoesterase [Bacilli bacterium]
MKISRLPHQSVWLVSDVHAHGMLLETHWRRKLNDDLFIILGDFINRGHESLTTLRMVMRYAKMPYVYVTRGNHEEAILRFLDNKFQTTFEQLLKDPENLYYQMAGELKGEDVNQEVIKTHFAKELSFLESLPLMLEDDDFIYVHAGIEARTDYENSSKKILIGEDYFYNRGHLSKKIVVCGHFPAAMYRLEEYSNNILIDLEKRIICIDGGLGATTYGQLNCLKIEPTVNGYGYQMFVNDSYKMRKVIQYQAPHGHHRGVCYPAYGLDIIRPSTSFTRVRLRDTDEEVYVKNEFIRFYQESYWAIDDVPNNHLEVYPEDHVKILCDTTYRYVLAMKNGVHGWIRKDYIEGY